VSLRADALREMIAALGRMIRARGGKNLVHLDFGQRVRHVADHVNFGCQICGMRLFRAVAN